MAGVEGAEGGRSEEVGTSAALTDEYGTETNLATSIEAEADACVEPLAERMDSSESLDPFVFRRFVFGPLVGIGDGGAFLGMTRSCFGVVLPPPDMGTEVGRISLLHLGEAGVVGAVDWNDEDWFVEVDG